MACFCKVPAQHIPSFFPPSMSLSLPRVSLPLQLAVALPALGDANRPDIRLDAFMNTLQLPTFSMPQGGLLNFAPVLAMMGGNFPLADLPALQMGLDQAADSLVQNLWPLAGWLTSFRMQPLLNFALAARLVLNLKTLGIDPFSFTMPAEGFGRSHFQFALSRPRLGMARFMAGLPHLMTLTETFSLPPLGESGAVSGLMSQVNGLATIRPPKLGISFPMLQKLALVLGSLATIKLAFGEMAFTPAGHGMISSFLSFWRTIPLPFPPFAALGLQAQLDALPAFESVQLGSDMMSPSVFSPSVSFSMPKLAFMPVMSLMMSLGASLQLALDMDPFSMCDFCPCA